MDSDCQFCEANERTTNEAISCSIGDFFSVVNRFIGRRENTPMSSSPCPQVDMKLFILSRTKIYSTLETIMSQIAILFSTRISWPPCSVPRTSFGMATSGEQAWPVLGSRPFLSLCPLRDCRHPKSPLLSLTGHGGVPSPCIRRAPALPVRCKGGRALPIRRHSQHAIHFS